MTVKFGVLSIMRPDILPIPLTMPLSRRRSPWIVSVPLFLPVKMRAFLMRVAFVPRSNLSDSSLEWKAGEGPGVARSAAQRARICSAEKAAGVADKCVLVKGPEKRQSDIPENAKTVPRSTVIKRVRKVGTAVSRPVYSPLVGIHGRRNCFSCKVFRFRSDIAYVLVESVL